MMRRTPMSERTALRFHYTPLFRSQEADILQRHFRYRGPVLQRAAGQGQRQAAGKPKHEHGDDAGAGIYAEWRPDGLPLLLLRTMVDRKSTRLNSSHSCAYRMQSSA